MTSGCRTAAALELRGIRRVFKQAGTELVVLNGIDLVLRSGEVVALVGPSGAGKSTMLHVAGLLERPDAGAVIIGGKDCGRLNEERRTLLRRSEIGFVYQYHHLLAEFSAVENVIMPQMICGLSRREARRRSVELLNYLGLRKRLAHRPAELSGGEQQRVAIARAVANAPRILLADEPTGNLDPQTAEHVFDALTQLIRNSGLAVIIATHNMELAARMDRRVTLRDGQVVELR